MYRSVTRATPSAIALSLGLLTTACGDSSNAVEGDGGFGSSTGATEEESSASETGTSDYGPPAPEDVECVGVPIADEPQCGAGSCPALVHLEITCNDWALADAGPRVAADDEHTWLIMSTLMTSVAMTGDAEGAQMVGTLPPSTGDGPWSLAQGDDGALWIASFGGDDQRHPDRSLYLLEHDDGQWIEHTPLSQEDGRAFNSMDLVDGQPRLWVDSWEHEEISAHTRTADGTWVRASWPKPAPLDDDHYGTTADGELLALGVERADNGENEVRHYQGDAFVAISDSLSNGNSTRLSVVPDALVPALDGSRNPMVAHNWTRGAFVLWGVDGFPTSIPIGSTSVPSCRSAGACDLTCTDTGPITDHGTLAVARTDDGTTWIAHGLRLENSTWSFTWELDEFDNWNCVPRLVSDDSSGELQLFRANSADDEPELVMRLPLDLPPTAEGSMPHSTAIDMRAWGDELAIGVRLAGPSGGDERMRLLRVDTTQLGGQ